jgi:cyclase
VRKRILTVSVVVLCLAAHGRARQGQTKIAITPVTGPVYMLQGGGGNIGIVADPAGLFMIDAMEEPVAPEIHAAVKSLPGGGSVRVLVNTHWHGDHTNGNRVFGPGAAIIAHEHVRPLLARSQTLMGQQTRPLPPEALPNITYSDRLVACAAGEAIRLVHYPRAHTDGDTVVYIDTLKVVHMGAGRSSATGPGR